MLGYILYFFVCLNRDTQCKCIIAFFIFFSHDVPLSVILSLRKEVLKLTDNEKFTFEQTTKIVCAIIKEDASSGSYENYVTNIARYYETVYAKINELVKNVETKTL